MSAYRQSANMLFLNAWDSSIVQLRKSLGAIANKEAQTDTLMSSQCFDKNHEVFMETARYLSNKRLEFDRQALAKFGVSLKCEVEWLKANQFNLLLENFWKNVVLEWYAKPMWNGRATNAENQLWTALTNLNHMAEREIIALSLEPEFEQVEKPQIVHNTYHNNGGQMNIASGNAMITAEMNINTSELDKLLTILIELLRSSKLPADLKDDAIDLAETAATQSKIGTPRQGILKALGGKLREVKDIVTGTDSLLHSSKDLVDTINQISRLLSP